MKNSVKLDLGCVIKPLNLINMGVPQWSSGLERLSPVREVRSLNPALGILFQNLNLIAIQLMDVCPFSEDESFIE